MPALDLGLCFYSAAFGIASGNQPNQMKGIQATHMLLLKMFCIVQLCTMGDTWYRFHTISSCQNQCRNSMQLRITTM